MRHPQLVLRLFKRLVEIFQREAQRPSVEPDQCAHQLLHRLAISGDRLAETRQTGWPTVGAAKAPVGQHIRMVAGQVPRHKERLVDIRLGDGCYGGGAESITPDRQVPDVVLVELDLQFLLERQSMKTRGLTKYCLNL